MTTPFPRLTPAQFASPANLRFAYSGWQTVVYNRNVKRKFLPKLYHSLRAILGAGNLKRFFG
jgi:hypothetical protein